MNAQVSIKYLINLNEKKFFFEIVINIAFEFRSGENNGIAYVTCTSCDYPSAMEDEDFNSILDEIEYPDESSSSVE